MSLITYGSRKVEFEVPLCVATLYLLSTPKVATMYKMWHLKGVLAMGIYVGKIYIPNMLGHA